MARIETSVEICIEDYLDEVDTDTLRDELESRGVDVDGADDLMEARAALIRGDHNEAICILDRLLFPKWSSPQACQAEYDRIMGRGAA